MQTKPRHNVFCRCGHARSFVGLGLRHVCGASNCECVKHHEAKPDRREEATRVQLAPIDSGLIDRILMEGAIEHLQSRISQATEQLQLGLSLSRAGMQGLAMERFQDVLRALGGLGAS